MSDTTTTPAPRPPAWRGWLRRQGGRWDLVALAEDEDAAWRALLTMQEPGHVEKLACRLCDPNDAPRKRPRRML